MQKNLLKVALAQISPVWLNKEKNHRKDSEIYFRGCKGKL